ncbi:MAG: DUF2238 domain-containing protein [Pseudomonadales bacterium]
MSTPQSWSAKSGRNTLLIVCAVVWGACAIAPYSFSTWAIEQLAVVAGLLILYWAAQQVRFSGLAQLGMAVLFCLHAVGSHYSYSLTPYESWSQWLTGHSLQDWFGWQRNHYDRLVHLIYGLSLFLPFQEYLRQRLALPEGAAAILSLHLVLSTSALYELLEWGAAMTVGADVGMAYLGTQGDIWDAHADIALAGLGAVAALLPVALRLAWVRAPQLAP